MAKVLIVDDQHELIELISVCLKIKGHITAGAQNKETLMSSLESFQPDLIILDVMLGKEDGRIICKELKESTYKNIPIILYSASRLMLDHFEEYHADDRLEKPFDIFLLQDKVEQIVSKS